LLQAVTQEDQIQAEAQFTLSSCYITGEGVEADTVQAALWCQRAAKGSHPDAIENLPLVRKVRLLRNNARPPAVRPLREGALLYRRCQLAHWNRETDTQKGHCRRLVPRRAADDDEDEDEASDEDGSSSSSAS
jgi:TPR repeat protein